jgi:hypothetical protein
MEKQPFLKAFYPRRSYYEAMVHCNSAPFQKLERRPDRRARNAKPYISKPCRAEDERA